MIVSHTFGINSLRSLIPGGGSNNKKFRLNNPELSAPLSPVQTAPVNPAANGATF